MEYVQMTLGDWVEMKRKLKQELLGVKQSFVRIGYALRKIEDQKLYENDGYKSIAEFAKAEYGLEPSTTSRFMSINREYSLDGYSETLRPEYAELGRSQLEEMLKLPDADRQMIQPEASREDIRDLKRFNKTEPAAGVADDLHQLIEKFYHDNPEILNKVFNNPEYDEQSIKKFAEIVNPGGNRSYKKGLYFLMMYENRVAVKKFGADPKNLTWWDFWQITRDIFGEVAAGSKTWQNYFGEAEEEIEAQDEEKPEKEDEKINENEVGVVKKSAEEEKKAEKTDPEESKEKTNEKTEEKRQKERIAPAQKSAEILEEEAYDGAEKDGESRAEDGEKDESEREEETAAEKEETKPSLEIVSDTEIIEKPFGKRKDWLDTLTLYGMAEEMAKIVKVMLTENLTDMTEVSFWEQWLNEEVDESGRRI